MGLTLGQPPPWRVSLGPLARAHASTSSWAALGRFILGLAPKTELERIRVRVFYLGNLVPEGVCMRVEASEMGV